MPALSFKREWLDALLSGTKTQTTRKPAPKSKPPRFKVGDHTNIYIEQRGKINTKPLRRTTVEGRRVILQKMLDKKYPQLPAMSLLYSPTYSELRNYYAHFLGTLVISDVSTITPSEMTIDDLEAWAWADGFCDFDDGDKWFVKHHSDEHWDKQSWEVLHWTRWQTRHYIPKAVP